MPRLRTLAIGALLFVAGWISYYWMTKIDHPDVYAYHEYTYWTEPRSALRPGDIVTVGSSGQLLRLCSLDPVENEDRRFMTAAYFNGYGAAAGAFVGLVGSVRDALLGDGDEDPGTVAVAADGRRVILTAANLEMEDPPRWKTFDNGESCEVAMARALSAADRRLPCIVQKSLLVRSEEADGGDPFTYAVRLATYANIPGAKHFEAIAREPVVFDAARAEQFECPRKAFPRDVRVRQWLRAIQREEL
ncbi:hypothetical protein LVO79_02920 [Roseivivax marinus]|uniref:hypothetical protein n=1 Tax=Roseivivax marinus TaxID=1379903 RepID=UPI001F04F220|nr:hypothetical protein [Roseivivax marinus]UMA65431.1 hypothetical protein LVO79_02920 [Roseivivax marinus]